MDSETLCLECLTRKRAWLASRAKRCARCGARGQLDLHHVVEAQRVKRDHGDDLNPANSMTLCRACHSAHTAGSNRIPAALLTEAHRAFAQDLLGTAADLYFARYYG